MLGYAGMLLGGFAVTLSVAVASFLVAVILGSLAAWGKISASRVVRGALAGYTTVVRGVPELVSILLIFYGAPILIQSITGALYPPALIRTHSPKPLGRLNECARVVR